MFKDKSGRRLFDVLVFAPFCDDCLKKGIEDKCVHKAGQMPSWKNKQKAADVAEILRQLNGETEMCSIQTSGDSQTVLHPKSVEEARELPPVRFSRNVDVIVVGIDPNSGGGGSKYALVSWTIVNNNWVVS